MRPFVRQFGAAPAEPAALGAGADQEAGHVDERDERDAIRVTEGDETRTLLRRGGIDNAAEPQRLVGEEANRPPVQPCQRRYYVGGVARLEFKDAAAIGDAGNRQAHVEALA